MPFLCLLIFARSPTDDKPPDALPCGRCLECASLRLRAICCCQPSSCKSCMPCKEKIIMHVFTAQLALLVSVVSARLSTVVFGQHWSPHIKLYGLSVAAHTSSIRLGNASRMVAFLFQPRVSSVYVIRPRLLGGLQALASLPN